MKWISFLVLLMFAMAFYTTQEIFTIFLILFFITSCILNKVNPIIVIFLVLYSLVYLCFITFVSNQTSLSDIFDFFNLILKVNLRSLISEYLMKTHNNEVGSFLSLILLNIKNTYNYDIYYKLIDLTVIHLIVISGFHINLICYAILKIFKKVPLIANTLAIITALIISYLNGFSPSSTRVLFATFFNIFKKFKNKRNDLSILLISLISPSSLTSIGLIMSYLGTRGIKVFSKLNIYNKFFNDIFSSVFALLYIIPFLSTVNDGISLWAAFFSFIFTPIFLILYMAAIIFCWFSFATLFFSFFYQIIYNASNLFSYINVYIPISYFNNQIISSFYYCLLEIINFYFVKKGGDQKWKLKNITLLYQN